MNDVYCHARFAPNAFGGDKNPFHPWLQVVQHSASGEETVILDFMARADVAERETLRRNCVSRKTTPQDWALITKQLAELC